MRKLSVHAWWLVAGGSLLSACSGGETPDWDSCNRDTVALEGSAEAGLGDPFAPFTDGTEIELEAGNQGLFHMFVSARMSGLEPGSKADGTQPWTYFTIEHDTLGSLFGGGCAERLEFAPTADGQAFEPTRQLPLVLNISSLEQAVALDGAEVTLGLTVVDYLGGYAEDTHDVVLRFVEP